MKITDIFVNRPVLATVITLLILLVGFRSMTLLELREYPRADKAVISVTTASPGAAGFYYHAPAARHFGSCRH